MRRQTRFLLLLIAGLPIVACFDLGKYSFPEQGSAGTGGSSAGPIVNGPGNDGTDPLAGAAGTGSDCGEMTCIRGLLPSDLGTSCQSGDTCSSGYCVDGVCCQEACGAACEACNVPGKLGYCQGIQSDDACRQKDCPPASACIQYQAASGACAGRGSCSTSEGCAPTNLPAGTPCAADGQCDGGGACNGKLLPLGAACQAGDQCTEGFCAATSTGATVCCNQACNGTCEQCSGLGLCNEAPALDPVHCVAPTCPADDVCHDYPVTPAEARCASFGTCVGSEACVGEDLRPASDCSCDATGCKLKQGASCSAAAQCATGFCNNGVCCESACGDTCEQCQQGTGVCGTITGCECAVGDTSTCSEVFGSRGDCAARTITCSGAGRWPSQQCNAQSAELCNNDDRDEDCDGDPRNGCACLNGTLSNCTEQRRSQGVCARRTLTCQNGQWPTAQCNATSNEVCGNGLDDNCNGAVDENPPCAPVFDGNRCQVGRPSCDSKRCSQCGGCDGCDLLIQCVEANLGCSTANDPVCRNNRCTAEAEYADQELFGDNFDIPATEYAADYVRCLCTQ